MTLLTEICDFTNPQPDGSPSLWDQLLIGSVPDRGGSGAKPASRLPTDAGVLSLVTEVEQVTRARGHRVPEQLRFIERRATTSDHVDGLAKDVRRWVGEARAALGLVPQRLTLPRGTRCIECDEGWVETVNGDGETVLQPAIVLLWREPGREVIDKVCCLSCGEQWGVESLHDLAGKVET